MRKIAFFLILVLLFFLNAQTVLAESPYVLPYPGTMPGKLTYKIHVVYEQILKYWYFGDFGQFKYNLFESDKYLVESKTLFDYKQYLLAFNALKKSDLYFNKIFPDLENANKHGKNILINRKILSDAAQKHMEELIKIKQIVPQEFNWSPEKSRSTNLEIHTALNNSIQIRKKYL